MKKVKFISPSNNLAFMVGSGFMNAKQLKINTELTKKVEFQERLIKNLRLLLIQSKFEIKRDWKKVVKNMDKTEISNKIKAIQNKLDRLEDKNAKGWYYFKLKAIRDLLYVKLGEMENGK